MHDVGFSTCYPIVRTSEKLQIIPNMALLWLRDAITYLVRILLTIESLLSWISVIPSIPYLRIFRMSLNFKFTRFCYRMNPKASGGNKLINMTTSVGRTTGCFQILHSDPPSVTMKLAWSLISQPFWNQSMSTCYKDCLIWSLINCSIPQQLWI